MKSDYLCRISVLDNGFVELIEYMGCDFSITSAARVSYLSESKGEEADKKLLSYLYENKHTSPFEMVEFKFRVKAPIFVVRQWFRHRTWSYNEQSRRYSSAPREFHLPTDFRKQSEVNKQSGVGEFTDKENKWFKTIVDRMNKEAETAYCELIESGVAREQARIVLPVSLYTTFYAKVDLRNLLHFLSLRIEDGSQMEMRVYAKAMLELVRSIVPESIKLFEKENGLL